MGAPIGSAAYCEGVLAGKVTKNVSKVESTIQLLHSREPCSLHSLAYSCLQPLFDYRMQTAPSVDAVMPMATRFDLAIEKAVAAAATSTTCSPTRSSGGAPASR